MADGARDDFGPSLLIELPDDCDILSLLISECPHCHARVIFMASGACPACRRHPEEPGARHELTRASIESGEALPPLCASCGSPTDRRERIQHREREDEGPVEAILFLMRLLHPLAWFDALSRGPARKLEVALRRCARCAKEAIVPTSIDLERMRMTFLVDRRFANALIQMRGRGCAAPGAVSPIDADGALSRPE